MSCISPRSTLKQTPCSLPPSAFGAHPVGPPPLDSFSSSCVPSHRKTGCCSACARTRLRPLQRRQIASAPDHLRQSPESISRSRRVEGGSRRRRDNAAASAHWLSHCCASSAAPGLERAGKTRFWCHSGTRSVASIELKHPFNLTMDRIGCCQLSKPIQMLRDGRVTCRKGGASTRWVRSHVIGLQRWTGWDGL